MEAFIRQKNNRTLHVAIDNNLERSDYNRLSLSQSIVISGRFLKFLRRKQRIFYEYFIIIHSIL